MAVTFPVTSPWLALRESVDLQQQIHTEPYLTLDERDDYSFEANQTEFADYPRVTLYVDGELAWGAPPR